MALILVPPAAGAQAATFTGGSHNTRNKEYVGMFVTISAITGTSPTLVVKLQESAEGTNWVDIPSFATSALAATGTVRLPAPATAQKCADFVRAICTIGGTTPSVTFTAYLCISEISGS
jgi:hypothetical protein